MQIEESKVMKQVITIIKIYVNLLIINEDFTFIESYLSNLLECCYLVKKLTRIIAVIPFQGEQGLAFHGDTEVLGLSNNGNYLGCLQLIAQLDDFLVEYNCVHGNARKGHTSLSS